MTESTYIKQCQAGSKEAYGFLVNRYKQRAYYIALSYTGSIDDAYDLSQDAFIKAFKHIKRFDPSKKFFTWFYQILKNLCLNHIRDNKASRYSDVLELESISGNEPDPHLIAERNELKKLVWNALDKLKPEFREIILLKDFEAMSYKEIAETLGIAQGTVMSRLFHARQTLKNELIGVLP
ncbi:MAG: sigma-70 family RNA polymerase sigma factor [Calditrichaeota bacterium]|nr:sigma-70 family RNA polymerase sigma factor [Calditrichota bacterium]